MWIEETYRKVLNGDFEALKLRPGRLLELLDEASSFLLRERQLIRVYVENKDKILVVGDTHGDLQSSLNSFVVKNIKIRIFLGDYVDRGFLQIENINYLLLRLLNEDNIILLRGNHESPLMNKSYGFLDKVLATYGNEGDEVYNGYVKVFSRMPYAALVNDRILMLHGGIAKGLRTLSQIERLPKNDVEPFDPIAFQLLWNDPDESVEEFAPSPRGSGIFLFGHKIVKKFMEDNGLEKIIRAHEFYPAGFQTFFNEKLITVFSCRFYPIQGPKAIIIKGDKWEVIEL